MKLSEFDTVTKANEGVEIELRRLSDGAPSGAFIKVYGLDSDVFRRIQTERAQDAIAREAKRLPALTPAEIEERAILTLARCTIGWRGIEGLPSSFSVEVAADLYRMYPAIREQINIAIADRANFLMG